MCVRLFVILLTFFQLYGVHIRISRTKIMKIKIKNIKYNSRMSKIPELLSFTSYSLLRLKEKTVIRYR